MKNWFERKEKEKFKENDRNEINLPNVNWEWSSPIIHAVRNVLSGKNLSESFDLWNENW